MQRIIVLQESDEESDIRSGCAHEDEKIEGDEEQKLRPVRIISDDEEDSENIVESKIRKAKILNFSGLYVYQVCITHFKSIILC